MKFKVPQTIADLSVEKLQALETEAVEAFDELKADPALSAAGLDDLKKLAKFVSDVRAELATREADAEKAAAAVQKEIEAATALVHPAAQETDEGGQAAVEPAPEPEPKTEVVEGEVVEPSKVPVLAGGARQQAAAARGRRGPSRATQSAVTQHDPTVHNRVTAAPDLPRHAAGQEIANLDELTDAFMERVGGFPRMPGRGRMPVAKTRLKHGVATIEKAVPDSVVIADGMDFWSLMDAVGDERKLSGGNLIAAGGWCAPNVRVWELCPGLETTAGIADFPSFTLQRGGIEYPQLLDFRDIYTNANLDFHQNEADSIAGTDKVCYTIPCPTFTSQRLEVDGICFSHDIVQNSVWPENTRDVIRRALIAHEHKINARLLAQVFAIAATGSVAVTLPLGTDVDGDSTTTGVLGALSLGAVDYRYRYRMDPTATLEGFAPFWLRDWIRADMARRAGVDFFSVSDAQIDQWFAARRIRLQFVYDLQDGYVGANTLFGGTGSLAALQWPASVQIVLFAAGTFLKGGNPIIDLSAVYDSTGLKDNVYTAAFTEESVMLLRRCQQSYRLTIPLCPTGVTGSTQTFDCVAA